MNAQIARITDRLLQRDAELDRIQRGLSNDNTFGYVVGDQTYYQLYEDRMFYLAGVIGERFGWSASYVLNNLETYWRECAHQYFVRTGVN